VSHLALARKYRPQTFGDLVAQDPVRTTLERAVATNRVAHAYLFAGPRGSGKTTTARLLAKALNCAKRKDGQAEPCNDCPSCVEITAGTSMDVLEIDGASNRGIEEIRNLRENVKYAPSGGKSKVYIIDEAHQLTDFAWNALLKTLEEPPAHVRFVFATTEALEVPDTIASRCQVFEFRRLRAEELIAHLMTIAKAEKVKLDEDAAGLIARASEGSVRDALSRLDQALAVAPEGVTAAVVAQALGLGGLDAFFDLGEAIAARDAKQALETLDRLYDGGLDVEEIADGLTHHLRQLLLLAVDTGLAKLIEAATSDRERYAAQATKFRANDLTAMLSLLLESRGQLRRAEAPRVLLEVCLVELCSLPSASDVGDLIQRLEALEKRLGGASDTGRGSGQASAQPSRANAAPSRAPEPPRTAAPPRTAPPPRAPEPPAPPRAERAEAAAVPAPPPETRIAPADQEDAVVRWRQAVDRVKERKLLLGTCLEEGLFLGIAGSNVRVALAPEHAFHRAMLEMKENREILNQEFERLYGRGTSLLCVSSDQAVSGVGYSARVPSPADLNDEEEEAPAAGDKLVQRIVELFDGEILNPGPQGSGAS
jgi:DNA polymerase-3 subunit gamma/tau